LLLFAGKYFVNNYGLGGDAKIECFELYLKKSIGAIYEQQL
jgi:hypothetical protein